MYRLGELFSGPGGMGWGAGNSRIQTHSEEIGIIHTWANDIDADSCATYIQNICPQNPDKVICSDVRNININFLPKIDGFAYGFPCNDFSIVGERKGVNGQFGGLYSFGIEVINVHRPKFFVAENVGGLKSANDGNTFAKIVEALSKAGDGYRLTVHLYRAEDYGVPQTRHRIIMVGIRKDLQKNFKVPKPTHIGKTISSKQAIEQPPLPKDIANNEISLLSKVVAERLTYIKPGENAWTADIPKHLQLNVKGAKISQIYKRLDPNKPAYTITGSGGGGTHGYHWSETRALTNRERARLQTFPDNFIFFGKKESVRKQIGMAVPPLLSEIIFTAILKTLHGVNYDFIPANFDFGQTNLF